MGWLLAVLQSSARSGAALPPASTVLAAALSISNVLVMQIFSVPLIAIQDPNAKFLPTKRQDGLWPNTKMQLSASWSANCCACSAGELGCSMALGTQLLERGAESRNSLHPSPSEEEGY